MYDDAYRCQAAAEKHWRWSEVNASLYAMCFTGKANRITRCEWCLSVAHKSEECVLPGDDDPDIGKRLKTIETAVVALTQPSTYSGQRNSSAEVCRKFNWAECRFRSCKFAHRCASCRGTHPASQCSARAPPQEQAANTTPAGPMRRPPQQRGPPQSNPY